jgi:hypothetical protein
VRLQAAARGTRHKYRVILRVSVQRGYVGNFIGELFSKQGHLGAALAGR